MAPVLSVPNTGYCCDAVYPVFAYPKCTHKRIQNATFWIRLYDGGMGRKPLEPGTHGAVSVRATAAGTDLAQRGAFVATVRYRVSGETKLLRRFGATEDEARGALLIDLDARLGTYSPEARAHAEAELAAAVERLKTTVERLAAESAGTPPAAITRLARRVDETARGLG